jgi:hypothetical protein
MSQVIRVDFTGRRHLPVFPDEPTFSGPGEPIQVGGKMTCKTPEQPLDSGGG